MKKFFSVVVALMMLALPVLAEEAEFVEGFEQYDLGIIIRLLENPTTGYTWRLIEDESGILTLDGDEFIAPETDMAGAGGMHTWRFAAGNDGDAVLTFICEQAWAPAEGNRQVTYTISVEGGAVTDVQFVEGLTAAEPA